MSNVTIHDLAIDQICQELTREPKEQMLITGILSKVTSEPKVASYRQEVFADILALPGMRKQMMELLDRISFLKDFATVKRDNSERMGLWDLLHRLDEINNYITCVEAMQEALKDSNIKSEGLTGLREYIAELYNDTYFARMKEDISKITLEASQVQSITIGVNLNSRGEATAMGLVSVNSKPFKNSGILTNFSDALKSGNKLKGDTEWNGDMHYQLLDKETAPGFGEVMGTALIRGSAMTTLVNVPADDGAEASPFYLDKLISKMVDQLVKRLRETLNKYVNVAIINISKLVPEFVYYIRFAEFVERCMAKNMPFCTAKTITGGECQMRAKGFYNLKLAIKMERPEDIVCNDLDFDKEHTVYILTGANRGGKTTLTQAVGLLFALAQGGIYVPATSFEFLPADCIYTHFPADEDKTLDLGRLGEECVRFKELYGSCTDKSLLLLNETFSTTSFEEGYYIARDSVKALSQKGIRTIYNTHMHKLASDADEMKASSLVMKNEGSKRSFKVEVAPPEGMSYARDIAQKYGVTYEMLTEQEV
ncbi:MAG: DNA mismatch repair protein [Saccharofermentans sp.]|nr:DNA mismatch repair protein [Saccharofermentans sp.]